MSPRLQVLERDAERKLNLACRRGELRRAKGRVGRARNMVAELLRHSSGEIRQAGRSTQGVKLINLEANDAIASIERLARDEDIEAGGKPPSDGNKPA